MSFIFAMLLSGSTFASGTVNVQPSFEAPRLTMSEFKCKADETLADCLERFKTEQKMMKHTK